MGIIDTTLNKCSSGLLVDMLSTNKKFNSSVLPATYKKKLLEYESSHENMIRSVSVYYSGEVAGKRNIEKFTEVLAKEQEMLPCLCQQLPSSSSCPIS